MKTLFTVVPSPSVGFTDQLTTLALAYDIGSRCGYEFRLTPFAAHRTSADFWSRYDLARGFPLISADESMLPPTRVAISGARARDCGVRSPDDVVAFVKEQVPRDAPLAVFDITDRRFFLNHIAWDESPGLLSFQSALRKVLTPQCRWSPERGLRVLVHLRCGDTADVPLIGHVNYRAWNDHLHVTRPGAATPFLGARLVMDVVREALGNGRQEFRVFTDGYERTAEIAKGSAGADGTITPGLSTLVINAIRIHAALARAVVSDADVTFSMGESAESLEQLIDAALEADLIIFTAAQRLIPKLLAALGSREIKPGLLLLDAQRHRFAREVRLTERHARLITLSLHGDPLAPLRAFLAASFDPRPLHAIDRIAGSVGAGAFCIPELQSLAASLEAQGLLTEARAVFEWLIILTDGSPASLAGSARCAARSGDSLAAEQYSQRTAEALKRCLANYQAAIHWKMDHGLTHDAQILLDEARQLLGASAGKLQPRLSSPAS